MATEDKVDVVIFGATGFTGKYAVEEILKIAKEKGNLTWGVAGRNEAKLKELLENISKKTGEELGKVPIIIADVSDEESLAKLAKRARVVVNCAGPYRFYGEPVVKACIANGAHHVDVSGEPQYMEQIQLNYHKQAEDKGVYVVSACGFDSIPADLGIVFLTQKFGGELNSVECYLENWVTGDVKSGGLHYGTWASAVYGFAHQGELKELRRELFPEKLPALTPKLKPSFVQQLPETCNKTSGGLLTSRCPSRQSGTGYEKWSYNPDVCGSAPLDAVTSRSSPSICSYPRQLATAPLETCVVHISQ